MNINIIYFNIIDKNDVNADNNSGSECDEQ